MENEALRRALLAHDANERSCWVAEALRARSSRFAGLSPSAIAYERNTELNEGLATYIQLRAAGTSQSFTLPSSGFAADAVRARAYQTGAALAVLLDRTISGWQRDMSTAHSLDELLSSKVYFASTACEYTDTEQASMLSRAQAETRRLKEKRAKLRSDFLSANGWQLVVVAAPKFPLKTQSFDPLNVTALGGREVLHTRYLKVSNHAGELEIIGRNSLTEASGEHPLFSGIHELTITGLDSSPTIQGNEGRVQVSASGVQGHFDNPVVHRTGHKVTIELSAASTGATASAD
jgi:hypothetical protein